MLNASLDIYVAITCIVREEREGMRGGEIERRRKGQVV